MRIDIFILGPVPTIFFRNALKNVACIALSKVAICCNMKLVSRELLKVFHIRTCPVLSLNIYLGKRVIGAILPIVDIVAQYGPVRVFDRISSGVPR